jgi:hypothetical protein
MGLVQPNREPPMRLTQVAFASYLRATQVDLAVAPGRASAKGLYIITHSGPIITALRFA